MTVVALHAFPLDERMWEPQRAALAEHELITPRLYGRGRTMDTWARAILANLDGELTLLGSSMGGYCALAMMRLAPERIGSALLVGSRPDSDSEERRTGRAATIDLIRTHGPEGLWQEMRTKLFADPDQADEALLFREPEGLIAAVEAIRDREDSTDVLRVFPGQALFVVGEHDPFVSAADLEGHDLQEIPGTGHLPNLERPEKFNEILAGFLDRA